MSLLIKFISVTSIGWIIDVIPNTAKILKIFDPIKLPTEIAFSFFITAITEVANSGTLVPKATTVILMILSETPSNEPNFTAPSINNSEPNHKQKLPKKDIQQF